MIITTIALATALFAAVPPTKTEPVKDTVHGVELVDDYRWLESLEKDSPDVVAWTTAQNDMTRATLDALAAHLEKHVDCGRILSLAR